MTAIIVFALLVLLALLAAMWLWQSARGRVAESIELEDLGEHTRPVDLLAFRNLADPQQEKFLRSHLTAEEFWSLDRERTAALLDYVERTAHNAAILIRLGDAARHSADASISEAGHRLADAALRMRLYALRAQWRLRLRLLLPGYRGVLAADFVSSYQQVTDNAGLLCRLQRPAEAGRVSAAL